MLAFFILILWISFLQVAWEKPRSSNRVTPEPIIAAETDKSSSTNMASLSSEGRNAPASANRNDGRSEGPPFPVSDDIPQQLSTKEGPPLDSVRPDRTQAVLSDRIQTEREVEPGSPDRGSAGVKTGDPSTLEREEEAGTRVVRPEEDASTETIRRIEQMAEERGHRPEQVDIAVAAGRNMVTNSISPGQVFVMTGLAIDKGFRGKELTVMAESIIQAVKIRHLPAEAATRVVAYALKNGYRPGEADRVLGAMEEAVSRGTTLANAVEFIEMAIDEKVEDSKFILVVLDYSNHLKKGFAHNEALKRSASFIKTTFYPDPPDDLQVGSDHRSGMGDAMRPIAGRFGGDLGPGTVNGPADAIRPSNDLGGGMRPNGGMAPGNGPPSSMGSGGFGR